MGVRRAGGRKSDDKPLRGGRRPGHAVARVSAAADGARALAQPERALGLRPRREGRAAPGILRGRDLGAVRHRIDTLGRASQSRPGPAAVVPADVPSSRGVEGRAVAAALRRRRLACRRPCERGTRRGASRGVHAVFARHHRPAGRRFRAGTGGLRVGSDGYVDPGARQAGQRTQRNLVHVGDRNLADRLAGARAGARDHSAFSRARPGCGIGPGSRSGERRLRRLHGEAGGVSRRQPRGPGQRQSRCAGGSGCRESRALVA